MLKMQFYISQEQSYIKTFAIRRCLIFSPLILPLLHIAPSTARAQRYVQRPSLPFSRPYSFLCPSFGGSFLFFLQG